LRILYLAESLIGVHDGSRNIHTRKGVPLRFGFDGLWTSQLQNC